MASVPDTVARVTIGAHSVSCSNLLIQKESVVLLGSSKRDLRAHESYAKWLKALVDGAEPFALSVLVAVGFVRSVTNRRIYEDPTPLPVALALQLTPLRER